MTITRQVSSNRSVGSMELQIKGDTATRHRIKDKTTNLDLGAKEATIRAKEKPKKRENKLKMRNSQTRLEKVQETRRGSV